MTTDAYMSSLDYRCKGTKKNNEGQYLYIRILPRKGMFLSRLHERDALLCGLLLT